MTKTDSLNNNDVCVCYFIRDVILEEDETAHDGEFNEHLKELPEPCFLVIFACHKEILLLCKEATL